MPWCPSCVLEFRWTRPLITDSIVPLTQEARAEEAAISDLVSFMTSREPSSSISMLSTAQQLGDYVAHHGDSPLALPDAGHSVQGVKRRSDVPGTRVTFR